MTSRVHNSDQFRHETSPHATSIDSAVAGIRVEGNQTQVELALARPGIFRISFSVDGAPKLSASVFLDKGNPAQEPWEAVTVGDNVGVKTSEAELLIDPATGVWTLLSAQGKALITQGRLGTIGEDGASDRDGVIFTVSMKSDLPLQFYGSGNGTWDLLKTEGNSHMDNGIAVIPYYWCAAGYGAFGVSTDDDSPAKWTSNGDDKSVSWTFSGRTADLYLMPAPSLREASQKFADLTGHPKVSPKWAFGYLQSRWGWQDKGYIDDTLKKFHDDKLPVDAFLFDFECYTKTPDYELKPEGQTDFPDFTWNPALFPALSEQIADFKNQGIQIIPIRKPRIGNSDTLQMMRDKGWILVTGKNGEKGEKMDGRDINSEIPRYAIGTGSRCAG